MRLDSYLVEMGFFKSRGRAKSAVEGGKVTVNGNVCVKASKNITTEDKIDVEEGLDMPKGYFKLKAIQELTTILSPGDYVLDLGSSAGGFMLCALEFIGPSGHIQGIEFSKDFRTELGKIAFEHKNAEIMFADVFTVSVDKIATDKNSKDKKFDVLLSDMTLEPKDSLLALSRMCVLLKDGGWLLQVIKIPKNRFKKSIVKKIESFGFTVSDVLEPQTQEVYIVAQKTGNPVIGGGADGDFEDNDSDSEFDSKNDVESIAGESENIESEFDDDDGDYEYDDEVDTSTDFVDITDMDFGEDDDDDDFEDGDGDSESEADQK
ncbi:S4 domain-containing protein [Methanolapillus africanus]